MQKTEVIRYLTESIPCGEELEFMTALSSGFARLHPDTELVWLSLPKNDPVTRTEVLEKAVAMLLREPKK